MKKIFQYIMLAVVTIVMASCTSDIEETTATTGKNNVQLVVGEFPTFGDSQTRAIGTPDEGKTSWAEGDELLLEMTSKTLGTKYAAFTYNGSSWELTSGELSYKEDEVPTFPHVYYAPNYKWEAGKLVLKEGKDPGTDEYIEGNARITGNGINVSFAEATRKYSRLRIATLPNEQITVDTEYFNAGTDEFMAIREAIKGAAPNDLGTIELTVIGVETIPEEAFYNMLQLKSVKMSDVKEIKKYAFKECKYLTVVEAPSLNKLCSGAFKKCDQLSKLTFGPINYADARNWPIFEYITPNIDFILSDYQKEMIETDDYLYTANNDIDYAGNDEHNSKNFLGREFKSITCRYKVE